MRKQQAKHDKKRSNKPSMTIQQATTNQPWHQMKQQTNNDNKRGNDKQTNKQIMETSQQTRLAPGPEQAAGIDGWMDCWMDGRMDGWIDGWMDDLTGVGHAFSSEMLQVKKWTHRPQPVSSGSRSMGSKFRNSLLANVPITEDTAPCMQKLLRRVVRTNSPRYQRKRMMEANGNRSSLQMSDRWHQKFWFISAETVISFNGECISKGMLLRSRLLISLRKQNSP